MKKRLLFISLALALVIGLMNPAVALAKDKSQKFAGEGWLQITYLPAPQPIGKGGKLFLFEGETVIGQIMNSPDWPELEGAWLESTHTTRARVDWETGKMKGTMEGDFTITTAAGTLTGTLNAKQKGNFYGEVVSKGSWRVTDSTGIFEGVKASGKWTSTVDATGYGPLTWEGRYQYPENDDDEDDGDDDDDDDDDDEDEDDDDEDED